MLTPKHLAELERLETAATPGPWTEDDGNVFSKPLSRQREKAIMRRVRGDESVPHPDDGRRAPLGWVCGTRQEQDNYDADCELIAKARSALPDLLAAARERDRLRAALLDLRAWADRYANPPRGMGESLHVDPALPPSAAKKLLSDIDSALAGDRREGGS